MDSEAIPSATEAPGAGVTRLIDLQVFQPLLDAFNDDTQDSDEGGLEDLFAIFFHSIPERMEQLRLALAGGDASGAKRLAHSIKGSCANFGALALATGFGDLEVSLAGTESHPGLYPDTFARLLDLYRQTEEYMRNIIDLS